MNRIRVVVADDEPLARRGLRQLLDRHDDFEVVGEARHGREAVRLLEMLRPDLVFLDVQMPELDAFGVLRALPAERLPVIVFVTAYDTFAVRAFELHALDYLVKPVSEARFDDALARARTRLRSRHALALAAQLSALLAGSSSADATQLAAPRRRLRLATAGADLLVDATELEWIEAEDYYCAVHIGGRRHLVRESLLSLEARLDRAQFARVHRSAIVNLAFLREIRGSQQGSCSVVLRDGTEVPVSRRRRQALDSAVRRLVQ